MTDKPYPVWICADCGLKYGMRPAGNFYGSTWHMDVCDVCGEEKPTTKPRDYGHLRDGWQKEKE